MAVEECCLGLRGRHKREHDARDESAVRVDGYLEDMFYGKERFVRSMIEYVGWTDSWWLCLGLLWVKDLDDRNVLDATFLSWLV